MAPRVLLLATLLTALVAPCVNAEPWVETVALQPADERMGWARGGNAAALIPPIRHTVPTSDAADFGSGNRVAARLPSDDAGAQARPSPRAAAPPPWRAHAAAFPVLDGRPMIAIVLDDLGLRREATLRASTLPGPLTLAFLPHAPGVAEQARRARANGHELLVHVPMEPFDPRHDPGPGALRADQHPATLQARLRRHLAAFEGYVGINNHMGSKLTADPAAMAEVMTELAGRGLLFLDSVTTAQSVAARIARARGVPTVERHVFLDHEIDPRFVARALAAVERRARRDGAAVAIGHPHALTLRALETWLVGLPAKGFRLVPISAIAALEACRRAEPACPSALGPQLASRE